MFQTAASLKTYEHHEQTGAYCADLVGRIREGGVESKAELYGLLKNSRYRICRHVAPQDVEDVVHDVYIAVLENILNGKLHVPECLMGYIYGIEKYQVLHLITRYVESRRISVNTGDPVDDAHRETILPDKHPDPEHSAYRTEQLKIIRESLDQLKPRSAELLTRFYMFDETEEEICAAMDITSTQFRLQKSRAKELLGGKGRSNLNKLTPNSRPLTGIRRFYIKGEKPIVVNCKPIGPLVLDSLASGPLPIATIIQLVNVHRKVAPMTVRTITNRLRQRGMVKRQVDTADGLFKWFLASAQ